MAHDDDGDLNRVWQEQAVQEASMTLDDVRARVRTWERKIARRNLREYMAAVVVVVSFGFSAVTDANTIVCVGSGLVILATLYAVWHLYTRGSTRSASASLVARDCLDFHRSELVRQRDLLKGVWIWYLLPFVPGVAVIIIGRALERPDRRLSSLAIAVVVVVFFAFVGWLNQRVAQKVQTAIDGLDRTR